MCGPRRASRRSRRTFTTCSPLFYRRVTGRRAVRPIVLLVIDVRQRAADGEVIAVGHLEIRPSERVALAAGRTLPLSSRELTLLAVLARNEGRIVPREELYAAVWGGRMRASDRSVDVYVHKLRSKLARALPEWRVIHTHFGFGYRLAPEPPVGLIERPHQRTSERERIR